MFSFRFIFYAELLCISRISSFSVANVFTTQQENNDILTTLNVLTEKINKLELATEKIQAQSTPPQKFNSTPRGRPFCEFCKQMGHVDNNCWRKHPSLHPRHSRGPQNQTFQNPRNPFNQHPNGPTSRQ